MSEKAKAVLAAVDKATEAAKTSPISVYSVNMFCCSVCAPAAMTADEVQTETNRINVCGTEKGWMISRDKKFSNGVVMPCTCEKDAGRRHWLLEA